MVLRPEKEAEARAVFDKWDLDFAIVGETIAEDRFIVLLGGEVKADLPLKALSGTAPEYDRPWVPTPAAGAARRGAGDRPGRRRSLAADRQPELLQPRLGLAPVRPAGDGRHRRGPPGSDAGVVRVHGTDKAIAFTSDVTPRYCRANPERGGMQAVAEAYRNLSRDRRAAAGGDRQPQLRQPREAGDHGPARRLHPRHRRRLRGARHADRLGQRQPLQRDRRPGDPADADDRRRRPARLARRADPHGAAPTGDVLLLARRDARATSASRRSSPSSSGARRATRRRSTSPPSGRPASSCARRTPRASSPRRTTSRDGGLALAAAEMALAGGVGRRDLSPNRDIDAAAWFFGEDQGRYLLACRAGGRRPAPASLALEAGVPLRVVGEAGGDAVRLGDGGGRARGAARGARRRLAAAARLSPRLRDGPLAGGRGRLDFDASEPSGRRPPDGDGSGGHRATDPGGVSDGGGRDHRPRRATATTTPRP